jgi:UDP-glucose 4-epimerase
MKSRWHRNHKGYLLPPLVERAKMHEGGNMTVLVLGGAGYIGSHTVYELVDRGNDVVIIDNLETGHIEAVHPKARFYQGDIRDRAFLDGVFDKEKIDAVIHFAANSLVGESMVDPLKYYDNNLCGTKVLLESMVAHDMKRIVFSSTAATYGEPERIPILEGDKTEPTNTYGETKLSMEKMFKWTDKAHGLKYVSLRYFNACGAHESGTIGEAHKPETHLIPLILQVPLKQREAISVFGDDYDTKDGTCIRDYIHVTDLAQAHILAVKYLMEGNDSNIFNLGNGIGFTVNEVIDTARKVTGDEIKAVVSPRRAGDPAQLIASSDKARSILGWNPEHADLEEIIASAWNWHKSHPQGYKTI